MFQRLMASLTLTLVMVGILSVLFSQVAFALPDDGRINLVTHFGGDVLYCVDNDFNPTNHYPDLEQGGFRLLDSNGKVLWFVAASQIAAAVQESQETSATVLVAEGTGTYGSVQMHTYSTEENSNFILTGYDEHGKSNSLTFQDCTPVGPIPKRANDLTQDRLPGTDPVTCSDVEDYNESTGQCESTSSSGVIDIGPGISGDDGLPV